jgi:hypothetical protein
MMVSRYLENELRMFRWIQLPLAEVRDLEAQKEIRIGNGHHYTDPETKIEMVELHVDSHEAFHEKMNATTKFGGNLSIRKPPITKPLICFGQNQKKTKKLGILFYPRPCYPSTSTCWVEQTAPFATTCVDVALVKTVMVIWGIRLGQAAPSLFLVGLMRCR